MLHRYVCVVALACALTSVGVAQQEDKQSGTAVIAGQVTEANSKAGLPAVVSWTRQFTAEETKSPFAGVVLTDAKGSFEITGLAAGTYAICVETPGKDYLDPCQWDPTPPRIEVKSGQKVKNAGVAVQEGVRLRFEVTDRENRVAGKGKTQGVSLSAYIPLPEGRRVELPLVRSEDGFHVLEAVVPADHDLPLVIDGEGLQFTDLEGRPWNINRAAYVIKKAAVGEKQQKAAIEVKGR